MAALPVRGPFRPPAKVLSVWNERSRVYQTPPMRISAVREVWSARPPLSLCRPVRDGPAWTKRFASLSATLLPDLSQGASSYGPTPRRATKPHGAPDWPDLVAARTQLGTPTRLKVWDGPAGRVVALAVEGTPGSGSAADADPSAPSATAQHPVERS